MILYSLDMNDFVSYARLIPSGIKIEEITLKQLETLKNKYPDKYRRWKGYLNKGIAKGTFAICDKEIVGYGWLKMARVNDPFYKIEGEDVAYLSEYFVEPSQRGKNIYPAMMSLLIEKNPMFTKYYISAYTSNHSSNKGILKVGFKPEVTCTFLRALKVTFNKHILN